MLLNLEQTLAKVSWVSLLHPSLNGGGVHVDGGSILHFDVVESHMPTHRMFVTVDLSCT